MARWLGRHRCGARCGARAVAAASAQDYPNRTVKIIVPFPAGGTADAMPRIVADFLSRKWGQPVIIENRAGAGGNVGADAAYQSEPDGYTLFASPPPPLVINQNLYRQAAVRSGAVHPARGDGQGAERDPHQFAEAEGCQNRRRLRRLAKAQSGRAQFRDARHRHDLASDLGAVRADGGRQVPARPLSRLGAGGAGSRRRQRSTSRSTTSARRAR